MTDEDAREAAAQAIMRSTGPDHPDRDNIFDRQLRTCRHLANLAIDTYASAMPQDDQAARIEALESRQRVLLEALEPFASIAVQAEQAWTSGQYYEPEDYVRPSIRLKHFTRARRALAGDA